MNCINLRQRYGDRYKITHDESYRTERPEFRAAEEPWLQVIECRNGHVFPWGPDDDGVQWLAASTSRAGSVAKRLAALPFTTVVQDGTDGVTVRFPPAHFTDVAEIMHPRRRRRLSAEARTQATERLKKYQFRPAVRAPNSGPSCDPGALPDPEPVQPTKC